MNRLPIFILVFLIIGGCKTEDVGFSAAESVERASSTPIAPPEPEQPEEESPDEPTPLTKPKVMIQDKPEDHFIDEQTFASFKVTEGSGEIESLICQVNGEVIACDINQKKLELKDFPVGVQDLKIRVVDENNLSAEDSAQWQVSERPAIQPPMVEIVREPQDHFLGDTTQVRYRLRKGTHAIDQVLCWVDQSPLACPQNNGLLLLENFGLGDHEFIVQVVDVQGLDDSDRRQWNISQRYIPKVTQIKVEFEEQLADILFVIDNSGSMQKEQLEVANRIANFFQKIEKINWRVGIITTDPYEEEPLTGAEDPLADGALLQFPNGEYFLNSQNLNINQARDYFAQTIFRPETGNGHERGIRNTLRTLERYRKPSSDIKNRRIRQFYRMDATLTAVVISDENETLLDGIGRPLEDQYRSEPDRLLSEVKDLWGQDKKFQWNSVVVRENDQACLGPDESYGVTYEKLSRMTDGVIEDICATDYTNALSKIGQGVVNLQKVYKLDCVPQDVNGDLKIDIEVNSLDGNPIPGYSINGNQIEFDQALDEGRYQIRYQCL